MSHLVELPEEEATFGELVVHLLAELLDALGVPVRQVSGVLALEELYHLI